MTTVLKQILSPPCTEEFVFVTQISAHLKRVRQKSTHAVVFRRTGTVRENSSGWGFWDRTYQGRSHFSLFLLAAVQSCLLGVVPTVCATHSGEIYPHHMNIYCCSSLLLVFFLCGVLTLLYFLTHFLTCQQAPECSDKYIKDDLCSTLCFISLFTWLRSPCRPTERRPWERRSPWAACRLLAPACPRCRDAGVGDRPPPPCRASHCHCCRPRRRNCGGIGGKDPRLTIWTGILVVCCRVSGKTFQCFIIIFATNFVWYIRDTPFNNCGIKSIWKWNHLYCRYINTFIVRVACTCVHAFNWRKKNK